MLVPTIETVDPLSFEVLNAALDDLSAFDWLLFTSANAVNVFAARRAGKALSPFDPGSPRRPRIAAIGAATARALTAAGLPVDLLPLQAVAESFAEALLPYAHCGDGSPARFLLVRAEDAREHLPETLRDAGAEVTVAPAYRTVVPAGTAARLREALTGPGAVQAVTFTSSSTARNLFALLADAACPLPADSIRASIGPITSATLQELGFPPHLEAAEATVESLAQSLVEYLRDTRTARSENRKA